MSTGLDGLVNALAVFDDGGGLDLYAAGSFLVTGAGTPARGIASWDGSSWSAVGAGLAGADRGTRMLTVFDDGNGSALYAGGEYVGTGSGLPGLGIMKWDGSSWAPLPGSYAPERPDIRALAVFDAGGGDALYACGDFQALTDSGDGYLARWGCSSLGAAYCVAATNSTGVGATIEAQGVSVVSANDFTLRTSGLPSGVPGLYFFGPNQVQLPFGDGFRCVGGATRRVQPPNAAMGTVLSRKVDLDRYTSIVPGASLNFQLWYRDAMAMSSGFNLSDAWSTSFQ